MDDRNQHLFKSKIRGTVQEVILPDFPDDDSTVTTTVTRSRRVSFGTNFVKEFIVGSAVSAQCVSEYEQAFSSSDSSNPNSSHSAVESGILDQNTFVLDGSQKLHHSQQAVPPAAPEPEPVDNRLKRPKFSSTICFSADSPTADMEFTEGCITLAKSILDKKNKEMTVIIQAKPKESKEEEKLGKEDEKCLGSTQFESSKCFKSKENKRFEDEKTKIFNTFDDEMSITKCDKIFKMRHSKMPSDDDSDDTLEDNCKENQIPLDMIMQHLDKDNTDLEKSLFHPEKSLSDVLSANLFNVSNESEKLNLNESMDISREFQQNFLKPPRPVPLQAKNDENQTNLPSPSLNNSDNVDEPVFKRKDEVVLKEVSVVKGSCLEMGVSIGIEDENKIRDVEMEITLAKSREINWNVALVKDDRAEEMEIDEMLDGGGEQMQEKISVTQMTKIFEHVEMDMSLTKVNKGNFSILDDETPEGEKLEGVIAQESSNQSEHQNIGIGKDESREKETNKKSSLSSPLVQKESEIQAKELPESSAKEMKSKQVSNIVEDTESYTMGIDEQQDTRTKIVENETYNVDIMNLMKTRDAIVNSVSDFSTKNLEVLRDLPEQDSPEIGLDVSQTNELLGMEEDQKLGEESIPVTPVNETESGTKSEDFNIEIPKVMDTEELDDLIGKSNEEHKIGNSENDIDMNMSLTKVRKGVIDETPSDETSKRVDVRKILEEHETSSPMREGVVEQGEKPIEENECMDLTVPHKEKEFDLETNDIIPKEDERRVSLVQSESEINAEEEFNTTKNQEEIDLAVPNKQKPEADDVMPRKDLSQNDSDILKRRIETNDTESPKRRNVDAIEPETEMELTEKEEINLKISEILSNSTPMQDEEMEKYFEKDPEVDMDNFLQKETEVMEVESELDEVEDVDETPGVVFPEKETEEVEEVRGEREPPLVDAKVIQCLKDQSNETGCIWSPKSLSYAQNEDKGCWSFEFRLLESYATVKFILKTVEDDFHSCSAVTKSEIFLNEDKQFRFPEYERALSFGFENQKKYFEDESKKVDTIRLVPFFLDQMNSHTVKLNSYLRQIDTILNSYPGSRLKGSSLSFRLFSFPLFFSSTLVIDLADSFRLSRSSLTFQHDFGNLDENKIKIIFQQCLKRENGLCEFVIRSTKFIFDLERQSGCVSKRSHIRLLPSELKL